MKKAEHSEADLVARLKSRDSDVLADLVNEHSRPLYRAARGMGFNEDEAEDMVQDVFITFLSSIDRFEGRSQLRTWLFGILHHKSMERRRKQAREDRHDTIDEIFEARFDGAGSWVSPPQDLIRLLESKQIGQAIAQCMDGLPALQRSVFVLREIEGLPGENVCKILGVSSTNMGVLMFRARNRLRECLEGKGWGQTR